MANRNSSIDLFKFIASLFIVGIHVNLFSDVNSILYFTFVHIIFRLAVPFFAICSGFFMSRSLVKNDYGVSPLKRQELNQIRLYLIWTILYFLFSIPYAVNGGYFTIANYKGFLLDSILSGSYYHLWYLLGLIYALPLFWIIIRMIKNKVILCILSIVLYSLKVFTYSYAFILPSELTPLLTFMEQIRAIRNAVLLILPFMLIGHLINLQKQYHKRVNMIGFSVSILFLFIEAFALYGLKQERVSFIFFTFPTAYFLFSVVLRIKWHINSKICTLLGSASLIIYCFHPMVIELFDDVIPNSVLLFIITLIISVTVSLTIVIIRTRISSKKHNK